jgi:hypothetical protein
VSLGVLFLPLPFPEPVADRCNRLVRVELGSSQRRV